MIFSTTKERNKRMEICRSCEHYNPDTRSCGTLILGGEGDLVDVGKKRKVRLCGCVMPLKTKFKIASCPLKKWGTELSKEDVKELKKLFGKIEGDRIKTEHAHALVSAYNKTFGANKEVTTCGSCLRALIKEIEETLKHE
jgi:hypothetical protein